jgi:hypothetical protein
LFVFFGLIFGLGVCVSAGVTANQYLAICGSRLIYASAAYGCPLARGKPHRVRATFYSRLSRYGPARSPDNPQRCSARFPSPSVPTLGFDHGDLSIPHSGVRSRGDSIPVNFLIIDKLVNQFYRHQYLANFTAANSEPISGHSGQNGQILVRGFAGKLEIGSHLFGD